MRSQVVATALVALAALPCAAAHAQEADGEWSLSPRGRLQLDAGAVGTPPGIAGEKTDFTGEVRRAFLGVDAKAPGGFSLRAEVDVATGTVEITDLYLAYKPNRELTFTLGQHKPFWGLEEMTSDLFPSFTERAALNNAFGHERRLGLSAVWNSGPITIQTGVFTRNTIDLGEESAKRIGLHSRVAYAPKIGTGRLHLGASLHYTDRNSPDARATYRVRPFIHTPDTRFISTGAITQLESELAYGLETAWIRGPFHIASEARWQRANRSGALVDPSFFGAYAEIGWFLTRGDTRGYKNGNFDRIKPARPLGKGGAGAVQVNLRYDYLDLIDGAYVGGKQDGWTAGLVWTPTDNTRLLVSYARLDYSRAALAAAGGRRDYSVDAFGLRAQFDF